MSSHHMMFQSSRQGHQRLFVNYFEEHFLCVILLSVLWEIDCCFVLLLGNRNIWSFWKLSLLKLFLVCCISIIYAHASEWDLQLKTIIFCSVMPRILVDMYQVWSNLFPKLCGITAQKLWSLFSLLWQLVSIFLLSISCLSFSYVPTNFFYVANGPIPSLPHVLSWWAKGYTVTFLQSHMLWPFIMMCCW
jgi:hypothetical protein